MPCIRPGAGLLFCPDAIQPHTSVYSAFCCVNAIIPPTSQNSAQGFTAAFPAIMPVQPPTIPDQHNKPLRHLCHAGGHTRARTRSTDTRYHRHARTLHKPAQPPIIIRYIRGFKDVPCCGSMPDSATYRRPCQLGGVSMLSTPGGWRSGTGSACPSSWRQDIVLLHKL